MPSSILFKCPESASIHVSKGFERDFGIRQSDSVDTHSFIFFDLETKEMISPSNSPFMRAEKGQAVAQHYRLQTGSRTMNCFVESGVVTTPVGE